MKKSSDRGLWLVIALGLLAAVLVPSPGDRFGTALEVTGSVPAAVEYRDQAPLFDSELDAPLQRYVMNVCKYYGLDPALVVALIEKESGCNPDAVGDDGESTGLMQVQARWHIARMESLGVTDLLNPYENIEVGVNILAEKLGAGLGEEWALMAYNGGNQYADKLTQDGKVSGYAVKIIERAEELSRKYGDE